MAADREYLMLAQRAVSEEWDVYKIMAEFTMAQRESDAKKLESLGYPELAEILRADASRQS